MMTTSLIIECDGYIRFCGLFKAPKFDPPLLGIDCMVKKRHGKTMVLDIFFIRSTLKML